MGWNEGGQKELSERQGMEENWKKGSFQEREKQPVTREEEERRRERERKEKDREEEAMMK